MAGALDPLTRLALAANAATLGARCSDAERERLAAAVAAVVTDPPPPEGPAGALLFAAIAFLDRRGTAAELGRAACDWCTSIAPRCRPEGRAAGLHTTGPASADAQMTFAALAAEAMGEDA